MPDIAYLRREASVKALQLRRALGVASNQAIDVYDAIRRTQLWLLFQPLDGLLGIYQRADESGGIVVNVKVHPALQRFTAAHELGHHLLGHELSVESERHIQRWSGLQAQELAAQMFAAEFLMPLAAVNATAALLDLSRDRITDADVYQMSLWLRTSYTAMIFRLQTLEWISPREARRLRAIRPRDIKHRLLGHPPTDARSDVHIVAPEKEQRRVSPLVGDELLVELEETPSSGFRWHVWTDEGIAVERDAFAVAEADQEERVVGGSGRRTLHFLVNKPSSSRVQLELLRPWDQTSILKEIAVEVDAEPRPEPGLDHVQRAALLTT